MATRRFCDRCGDESGSGEASFVREVIVQQPQTGMRTAADLCGVCHKAVVRTMTEKLSREGKQK